MSSDDVAIRVSNLSKCYQIYDAPRDRLKQFLLPRLQRLTGMPLKQYFREFWALNDVSFEVKKGETVGIIGRNGSGKSTLLQLICGTLNPTNGSVETSGRIAALLELGSGFNSEFTGRENVYMSASLLGLSHEEVDARFNDIATFADIGDFIEQPVKTYSSGMMVRLAFAVTAHVDAEILIIDEALAVGDAFFQQKCMRFLHRYQDRLGTVLFVSHDTGALKSLCDRAILLNAGSIHQVGDSEEVSRLYLEQLYADTARRLDRVSPGAEFDEVTPKNDTETQSLITKQDRVFDGDMSHETLYVVSAFRPNAERFGDGGATIIDAGFLDQEKHPVSMIKGGQPVNFFIRVCVETVIKYPAFGFMIKNGLGEYVFTEGTDTHFRQYELLFREQDIATAIFFFMMPHLNQGKYFVNVAFAEGLGDEHIQHCWIHDAIQIDVVKSRLAHGYCGMNDIAMTIVVSSREESGCQ